MASFVRVPDDAPTSGDGPWRKYQQTSFDGTVTVPKYPPNTAITAGELRAEEGAKPFSMSAVSTTAAAEASNAGKPWLQYAKPKFVRLTDQEHRDTGSNPDGTPMTPAQIAAHNADALGLNARGAAGYNEFDVGLSKADDVGLTQQQAEGTARALARGATFNFAPRIEAAGRAAFGNGTYEANLADIRAKNDAFDKLTPGGSFAAQLAGGLLVPGGVAGNSGKVATVVKPSTVLTTIANGLTAPMRAFGRLGQAVGGGITGAAATGAAMGAVAGIGDTKDLTTLPQVAYDAAAGGAGGALIGGGLGAGVKLAQPAFNKIAGYADDLTGYSQSIDPRKSGPEIWAARQATNIAEGRGLFRANQTAQDFDGAVADAAIAGLPTTLASVRTAGDARLGALLAKTADNPKLGESRFVDFAETQLDGQARRIADQVTQDLGGGGSSLQQLRRDANDGFKLSYDELRSGELGGANGPVNLPALNRVAQDNPELLGHMRDVFAAERASGRMSRADELAAIQGIERGVLPDDLHPAALESLYTRLSVASADDPVARGLSGQLKTALASEPRGQALLDLKAKHSDAHNRVQAAEIGARTATATGTKLADSVDQIQGIRANHVSDMQNAAADAMAQKLLGDSGTFARPSLFSRGSEEAAKRQVLFGQTELPTSLAQALSNEQALHDMTRSVVASAKGQSQNGGTLDQIMSAVRPGQSNATIAWRGLKHIASGRTTARDDALARLLMSPDGIATVQAELAKRSTNREALVRALEQAGIAGGKVESAYDGRAQR